MEIKKLTNLIVDLKVQRAMYEEAKDYASKQYDEVKRLESEIMKALDESGLDKMSVPGVGTVIATHHTTFRQPSSVDSWNQFRDYVMEKYGKEAVDNMFKVHSQTLSSFCKKEYEEAEAQGNLAFSIPGVDMPTEERRISFRKK